MMHRLIKGQPLLNHNDIVMIRVTHDGQTDRGTKEYKVFRELTRWHSTYFAAALDPAGGFLEHTTGVLQIGCDHKVLDAFINWLHTGRLKDVCQNATAKHEFFLSFQTLCMLWVFSDCRGIPELGNAVIDSLHERSIANWTSPHVSTIQYFCDNSVAGCALRKFFLHFYIATKIEPSGRYEKIPEFCSDLEERRKELATTGMARQSKKAILRLDRCQWHDHSGRGGKMRLALRTWSLNKSHGRKD